MRSWSPALLATLLTGTALVAASGPKKAWQISPFTWIRCVPAEAGATPNGHPLKAEPAVLEQALRTVRFMNGAKEEALFSAQEAQGLSRILSEALEVAAPGEDLELLSTSKRESWLLDPSLTITARLFAQDGRLHLLVHDTRLDFVYTYYIDFRMPKFVFGSRKTPSPVSLKAAGAESRRADWLVLPLPAVATPAAAVPPAPAPVAPAPKPAPAATLAPPPAPPKPLPASLEERLRKLKQLRDQDLISEADYQKRKQELLKEI